jgi:site-specific DNA-methyltransferase (adenine-specific)
MGTLYYGDNLDILRRYLKDESVDLVYLDPPAWPKPLRRSEGPPFNFAQNNNAFFQEKDPALARRSWAVTEQPGKVFDVMQAFYTFLGGNDMMAYLTMMSSRLVELRRVVNLVHIQRSKSR